jgi:GTP-binding protein HflX
VLAGLLLPGDSGRTGGEPLGELRRLAESAGALPVGEVLQRRDQPTGSHYLGRGKVEEIKKLVHSQRAACVIFDEELSPVQGRNLEAEIGCPVMDRTELILDIFATGAHTRQAQMQVELASLEYGLPRLRRRWTHLERQVGGIGVRGGAGERQIEVDRRLLGRRITEVKRELEHIRRRCAQAVASRRGYSISLVGYTNAGKSTLMRALTGADVTIEDRLFATLDTRTRELKLGGGLTALLSDTIGFVRRLPHHLVASFSATLEETRQADLVLHVVDLSSPIWRHEMETVRTVLADIGADARPVQMVFNKIDRLAEPADIARALADFPDSMAVSALHATGLADLRERLAKHVMEGAEEVELLIPAADGRTLAMICREGRILENTEAGENLRLRARVTAETVGRLRRIPGISVVSVGNIVGS